MIELQTKNEVKEREEEKPERRITVVLLIKTICAGKNNPRDTTEEPQEHLASYVANGVCIRKGEEQHIAS